MFTNDVFQAFAAQPDLEVFSKTVVPVHLLGYHEDNPSYVTRSQAKRLLARFDQFSVIQLDFSNVQEIGQGFADEVFRVFVNAHPDVSVEYIHASKAVEKMIRHVIGRTDLR